MLIIMAQNLTPGGQRCDGTCDYQVQVRINRAVIYDGKVLGHYREAGAADLLMRIALQMPHPGKTDEPRHRK